MTKIILASTSKYRKKLLADAGFDVEIAAPDYEETPIPGTHPFDQIAAFARGKAASVARFHPDDIVIGSDQGLVDGMHLVGKPGTIDKACAQLRDLKGKSVILATSVVVSFHGQIHEYQDRAELHFRENMSDEAVRQYVLADMPIDCAGSFKIESRGSRLFSSICCNDPTAIQGLPMMKLNEILVMLDPGIDLIF